MKRLILLIFSFFGTQEFTSRHLGLASSFDPPVKTNLTAEDPNVKINCSFYNTSIWVSADFFKYNVSINNPTQVYFLNELSQVITGCNKNFSGNFHAKFSRFAECASGVVNKNNILHVSYKLYVPVSTSIGPVRDIPTCIYFVCHFCRNLSANYLAIKPKLRKVVLKNLTAPGNLETRFERCSNSRCDVTVPFSLPIWSGDRLYLLLSNNAVSYFNLVLQATVCWATSTSDPNSSPRFTFVDGGCPKDTTIIYENFNSSRARFSIGAFTWVDTSRGSNIYIHCTVVYCTTTGGNNCSNPQACSSRRKRFIQPDHKGEIVTTGPIHITPSKKCDKKLLGCSHECRQAERGSFMCSCPSGYKLASDQKSCHKNQGNSFPFYHQAKETILIVKSNMSMSSFIVVGLLSCVVFAMLTLFWRMYKRTNKEKGNLQVYMNQDHI